ncbi:MAG: SMP-30/gluconolactonase/LRE family protein, partial [Planctomycetota bacterium]
MRTLILGGLLVIAASAHAGEAPGFAKKPTATRKNSAVTIDFAVSAPTDVTMWVEDGAGKTIRRIGAAGLGAEKVPSPFQPKALAQSIAWDGKDSKGKPAPAGSRIKVALGMRAKLAEILGQDDTDFPGIHGVGVRPGSGELYVLAEGPGDGKRTVNLSVLDRDGKHLRTLIPAPNSLPWEKAEKLGAFKLPGGKWIPRLFHPTGRCFTPLSGRPTPSNSSSTQPRFQGLAVSKSGTVYRVNRVWTRYVLGMHAADGGAPGNTTIGPWLPKKVVTPKMALSPDEKSLCIVGLQGDTSYYRSKPGHAVWKVPVDPPGEATPLIGDAATAGTGSKLNGPRGVSVDKKGRIYVSDHGNGRVAQFDASGKLLAELKVEKPECLSVSPDGAKIYLLRRLPKEGRTRFFELARYDGMKAAAPGAALKLNCGMATDLLIAVDYWAETPVVWVVSASKYCRFRLLRVGDLGAKFADGREIDTGGSAANMPSLGVDPETDDLFVRRGWGQWLQFKAGTGKPLAVSTNYDEKGSVMDVGPDGSRWWLGRSLKGAGVPLVRTDRDN